MCPSSKQSRSAKRQSAYDQQAQLDCMMLDFDVLWKIAEKNGLQLKDLSQIYNGEVSESLLKKSLSRLKDKKLIIHSGHSTAGEYRAAKDLLPYLVVQKEGLILRSYWLADRKNVTSISLYRTFLYFGCSFVHDEELFREFFNITQCENKGECNRTLNSFNEQHKDDKWDFADLPIHYQSELAYIGIYEYLCHCAKNRIRYRTILRDFRNPVLIEDPLFLVRYAQALERCLTTHDFDDFLRIRQQLDFQFNDHINEAERWVNNLNNSVGRKNEDPKRQIKQDLYKNFEKYLNENEYRSKSQNAQNLKSLASRFFKINETMMKSAGYGSAGTFLRKFQKEFQIENLPVLFMPGNYFSKKIFYQFLPAEILKKESD